MNEYYVKTVFLGEQAEMQKLKAALECEPVEKNEKTENIFTKIPVDNEYSPLWANHLYVSYTPVDENNARLDISYESRGLACSLRDYCQNHGINFKQNCWYVKDDCAAWETSYFYENQETGEEKDFVVIDDMEYLLMNEIEGDVFDLDDNHKEVNPHMMTDRENEILAFVHNRVVVVKKQN